MVQIIGVLSLEIGFSRFSHYSFYLFPGPQSLQQPLQVSLPPAFLLTLTLLQPPQNPTSSSCAAASLLPLLPSVPVAFKPLVQDSKLFSTVPAGWSSVWELGRLVCDQRKNETRPQLHDLQAITQGSARSRALPPQTEARCVGSHCRLHQLFYPECFSRWHGSLISFIPSDKHDE